MLMSIQKVSTRQIKAARALLSWSQSDLSLTSGVSIPTIKRLEARDGPLSGYPATAKRIISAFDAAGIEFIDENGGGVGVRLRRKPGREVD